MTELEILINAGHPLLFIPTVEEETLLEELDFLLEQEDKRHAMATWSPSAGLSDNQGGGNKKVDPNVPLTWFAEKEGKPTLVLFSYNEAIEKSILIRRRLVELSRQRKGRIIMVHHTQEIHPDLEDVAHLVDFPLPDRDEISTILWDAGAEANDAQVDALRGLSRFGALMAIRKSKVVNGGEVVPAYLAQAKKDAINKSGILEYMEPQDLPELGGLQSLKDWLKLRKVALGQKARDFGVPAPKGILCAGPPGTGKSMLAKVVARDWSLPLVRFDVGKVYGKFVGDSEGNIRRALRTLEAVAPCTVLVDEAEKSFSGGGGDSGVSQRVLGNVLTWLQEQNCGVFSVFTVNRVELLPAELIRKGRLDELFVLDLPSEKERYEIFESHLCFKKRDPDEFDIITLARVSDGFTGAEIEQVVNSALLEAFAYPDDEGPRLQDKHLIAMIDETVPLSRTMGDQIRAIREWGKTRARPAS